MGNQIDFVVWKALFLGIVGFLQRRREVKARTEAPQFATKEAIGQDVPSCNLKDRSYVG